MSANSLNFLSLARSAATYFLRASTIGVGVELVGADLVTEADWDLASSYEAAYIFA